MRERIYLIPRLARPVDSVMISSNPRLVSISKPIENKMKFKRSKDKQMPEKSNVENPQKKKRD